MGPNEYSLWSTSFAESGGNGKQLCSANLLPSCSSGPTQCCVSKQPACASVHVHVPHTRTSSDGAHILAGHTPSTELTRNPFATVEMKMYDTPR